jgi:hypothetical protein
MARRPALIKKTAKKNRVSRSEGYLVNLKYLGDEPFFNKPVTNEEYAKALTWYNYMSDTKEAREYLQTWLTAQGRKDDAKKLNRVPDAWIPTTVAYVCRMMSRGAELPASSKAFVLERIQFVLQKATGSDTDHKPDKPTVSVQDRMRDRQSDIIGDIEALIDSEEPFSLYDWLKSKEIPAAYCGAIVEHYAPWLGELIEAYEGGDPDLKEAYRHYTKPKLKERILFFNTLIEDAERYGNVTKKTRAPRKPRTVSVEKKLKHLKYQKESNEYKIASINPEKILGAQELWCFNTKYKIVTVFRAIDRGGLQINRSSITGYDEKNSQSKGCGRKPEIVLDKLQNGGKIVLKKLMSELKTDKPLQFRINENTILMKVM